MILSQNTEILYFANSQAYLNAIAGGEAKYKPIKLPGVHLLRDIVTIANAEPLLAKDDLEAGGNRFIPATSLSVSPFRSNERLTEN